MWIKQSRTRHIEIFFRLLQSSSLFIHFNYRLQLTYFHFGCPNLRLLLTDYFILPMLKTGRSLKLLHIHMHPLYLNLILILDFFPHPFMMSSQLHQLFLTFKSKFLRQLLNCFDSLMSNLRLILIFFHQNRLTFLELLHLKLKILDPPFDFIFILIAQLLNFSVFLLLSLHFKGSLVQF